MSNCSDCGAPLEWTPSREHARCSRCAGLYTADGTPVRLEAPGGGFNPGFQAVFEQQLGFSPRVVPPTPPRYWGGGGGMQGGAPAPMPANPVQRIIQLSIAGLVLFILAGVGLYVAWVVYSSMPH
jgi:hypothetical protein